MIINRIASALLLLMMLSIFTANASAQSAPTSADVAGYQNLHAAAHEGDVQRLAELLANGADTETVDGSGRTPLHVAAFASHEAIIEQLAEADANLDALESSAYDIVTIAAVNDDIGIY